MATNNNTIFFFMIYPSERKIEWDYLMRLVSKHKNHSYARVEGLYPRPTYSQKLANNGPRAQKNAYDKHRNDYLDLTCPMLASMNSEL